MRTQIIIVSSLFIAGCTNGLVSEKGEVAKTSVYDVNKYAVNKTVCNPMGGNTPPADPGQGIHASLYYLKAGQPRYNSVGDMIGHGTASQKDLFFTEINVPTRMFTEGFPLQTGGKVQDDQKQDLLEYFALRFEGVIHLGSNDDEGDYQFGILSDDGTIMSLSNNLDGENYSIAINNDGDHPTRMGCGPIVPMSKQTRLSMRLDYYQGPRYHIALLPMWRNVNQCSTPETLCGATGNNLFFDPNHGSNPLAAYMQLLSRGWHPLSADNYSLSPKTEYNPCVDGTAPVISDLKVVNDIENYTVHITWTTDIPATDQVLLIDTATKEEYLSPSDNLLRTSHHVVLQGHVYAGHNYTIQAISISEDLGKTISAPVPESLGF